MFDSWNLKREGLIALPLTWRKSLSNYIETHCLVAFLVNFTDATCLGVMTPLASTI